MQAQDFITDLFVELGITAAGVVPNSDESNYALRLWNQVLDSWSAEGMPIPFITKSTVTLTGAASYALSTRPLKIKSASISGNTTLITPVEPVDAEHWEAGAGAYSRPALLNDNGWPTATIYLRPSPPAGTLEMWTYLPLTQIAALTTVLDTVPPLFPPGYLLAMRNALKVHMAEGFGVPVTQAMILLSQSGKSAIINLNAATLGNALPADAQAQAAQAAAQQQQLPRAA